MHNFSGVSYFTGRLREHLIWKFLLSVHMRGYFTGLQLSRFRLASFSYTRIFVIFPSGKSITMNFEVSRQIYVPSSLLICPSLSIESFVCSSVSRGSLVPYLSCQCVRSLEWGWVALVGDLEDPAPCPGDPPTHSRSIKFCKMSWVALRSFGRPDELRPSVRRFVSQSIEVVSSSVAKSLISHEPSAIG